MKYYNDDIIIFTVFGMIITDRHIFLNYSKVA